MAVNLAGAVERVVGRAVGVPKTKSCSALLANETGIRKLLTRWTSDGPRRTVHRESVVASEFGFGDEIERASDNG